MDTFSGDFSGSFLLDWSPIPPNWDFLPLTRMKLVAWPGAAASLLGLGSPCSFKQGWLLICEPEILTPSCVLSLLCHWIKFHNSLFTLEWLHFFKSPVPSILVSWKCGKVTWSWFIMLILIESKVAPILQTSILMVSKKTQPPQTVGGCWRSLHSGQP